MVTPWVHESPDTLLAMSKEATSGHFVVISLRAADRGLPKMNHPHHPSRCVRAGSNWQKPLGLYSFEHIIKAV